MGRMRLMMGSRMSSNHSTYKYNILSEWIPHRVPCLHRIKRSSAVRITIIRGGWTSWTPLVVHAWLADGDAVNLNWTTTRRTGSEWKMSASAHQLNQRSVKEKGDRQWEESSAARREKFWYHPSNHHHHHHHEHQQQHHYILFTCLIPVSFLSCLVSQLSIHPSSWTRDLIIPSDDVANGGGLVHLVGNLKRGGNCCNLTQTIPFN